MNNKTGSVIIAICACTIVFLCGYVLGIGVGIGTPIQQSGIKPGVRYKVISAVEPLPNEWHILAYEYTDTKTCTLKYYRVFQDKIKPINQTDVAGMYFGIVNEGHGPLTPCNDKE